MQHYAIRSILCLAFLALMASACLQAFSPEHEEVTAQCTMGRVVHVSNAYYGLSKFASEATGECGVVADLGPPACPNAPATLDIVKGLCEGKQSCVVDPENTVFTDPCPGTFKNFKMTYTCECGRPIVLHETHDISTWWFGFSVEDSSETIAKVEISDAKSRATASPWMLMQKTTWGPWVIDMESRDRELVVPFSVRLTAAVSTHRLVLDEIITSIEPETDVPTTACFDDSLPPPTCESKYYIKLMLHHGGSVWWFALYLQAPLTPKKVYIRDASVGAKWQELALSDWGPWIYTDRPEPLKLPLDVYIETYNGACAYLPHIIHNFTPDYWKNAQQCLLAAGQCPEFVPPVEP